MNTASCGPTPSTLETLASLTDGEVVPNKTTPDGRFVQTVDHFRRDPKLINPRSFAALWPTLLWLAACLFLGDVAVRRIALDVDWLKQAAVNEWKKLRGQETATASEYMDKLRSRKAEVDEQLDRTRARPPTRNLALPFPDAPPSGADRRTASGRGRDAGPRPRGPEVAEPQPSRPRRRRPRSKATPTDCSRPSSASGRKGRKTRNRKRKTLRP